MAESTGDLEDTPEPEPSVADGPVGPRRWIWIAAGIAGAVLLAGIFLVFQVRREPSVEAPLQTEPLTAYRGEQYSPNFSPDGSHIVFVWNGPKEDNFDLYIQPVGGGGEPRRLTDHPDFDFSPAWSPDGKWIAFLRRSPENRMALEMMPAVGGSERKVADLQVTHYMEATGLCWSPDGKWIIAADADRGEYGLYLISVETGERRRLTKAKTAREHLDPALSPDARTLAFRCENNDSTSEICLQSLDDHLRPVGTAERVTSLGRGSNSPVWVAGGRDLVFSSGIFLSDSNLYRTTVFPLRKRTGAVRQLTWGAENQFSLAVSRRGDLMAYTRRLTDDNIWSTTWDPATGRAQEPSPILSSNRMDLDPDFSPDGKQIAFASDRSGSMEIWVAREDGSAAPKMTSFGRNPANSPRWSPHGRSIVFAAGETGRDAIYIIAVEGGPVRMLVKPEAVLGGLQCSRQPSWSGDGKWIYYSAGVSASSQVFRLSISGGNPQQITRSGGCRPQESPDGRSVYYTAEGGLWRITISGGVPELVVNSNSLKGLKAFSYVVRPEGIFTVPLFTKVWGLDFHRLADGSVTHIASGGIHWFADGSVQISSGGKRTSRGLTVSSDGRRILYPLTDEVHMNLVLVRNPG